MPPPDRILIVRPSALGDVSRTVPALVTLRQAYPAAEIHWLVADFCADVVRHHPMLDDVIVFDRRRLSGFGLRPGATRGGFALARRLRGARYDVVYDLQGLFRSGLLSWLTGAARRVGPRDARELGWLGYNVRHAVPGELAHTVDRMLALLAAEGLAVSDDMRLYVGSAEEQWFAGLDASHGLMRTGYGCVAPTARWLSKCWPIERYAAIARRLLATGIAGEQLVVLAAPSERDQVRPLLDALTEAERARVHLPRTTVGQMMALIRHSRLLLCNDSAPLHIAVGFDRPIVALFGPTDPARVGPYRRPEAVIRPPGPAPAGGYRGCDGSFIARIREQDVWERIEQQLG